jgi:Rrf2 family protein
MKISVKGDYAIKALLDLSLYTPEKQVSPISGISERQNIPLKYLEQIMLLLKGAGYVNSKRGVKGGFYLIKSPAEITLGEIIRLVEGSIEPISYDKNFDGMVASEQLVLEEIWSRVTASISDIIDRITFDSLMRRTRELQSEKMGYMYQI